MFKINKMILPKKNLFLLIVSFLACYPTGIFSENPIDAAENEVNICQTISTLVRKKYLDPTRIDPSLMLKAFCGVLERKSPSLFIRPSLQKNFCRIFNGQKLLKELPLKTRRLKDFWSSASRIMGFLKDSPEFKNKFHAGSEIFYEAATAALKTLDPHSRIYSPRHTRQFLDRTQGSRNGIGIIIFRPYEELEVLAVLEGSPAQKRRN